MYDWSDRCDLIWNSRFETDKGIFVVDAVQFYSNGDRKGLWVIREGAAEDSESKFIDDAKLIEMEKQDKFCILNNK